MTSLSELDARAPVPDQMTVLYDFSGWVDKAMAGDTSAMLGIYDTLANCLSFDPMTVTLPDGTIESSSARCGNVPEKYRTFRIRWLDLAAAKGDLRAMLAFGLNAKGSELPDGVTREVWSQLALTRLNDAAASGLSEAFSALYEAHRSGWYGPRDNTMAAAYAIAAHELMPDSIGSADYFKILDALRVGDRAQAEATAKQIVLRTRQK